MATTYTYTRSLVDGSYNVDSYSLSKDIESALSGLNFSIDCNGTDVNITFDDALSTGDETILTDTFNTYVLPVVKKYKLYEYHTGRNDEYKRPSNIDYIRTLENRLHYKQTMVKGVITQLDYYADYNGTTYSNPVVRETYVYTYGASNLVASRDLEIQWYYDDGTLSTDKKVRKKYYTSDEAIIESRRRRSNILNKIQLEIVGFIQLTNSVSQYSAIVTGSTFFNAYLAEVNSWLDTPALGSFQSRLNAETDGLPDSGWLFNDISAVYVSSITYMQAVLGANVSGVTTVRDYILNQINY